MCTSEANSKSRKFKKTPFDVLFLANSLVYTYFPFNINLSVQQERSHMWSVQFNILVDPARGYCYRCLTKPCESNVLREHGVMLSNTWITCP